MIVMNHTSRAKIRSETVSIINIDRIKFALNINAGAALTSTLDRPIVDLLRWS